MTKGDALLGYVHRLGSGHADSKRHILVEDHHYGATKQKIWGRTLCGLQRYVWAPGEKVTGVLPDDDKHGAPICQHCRDLVAWKFDIEGPASGLHDPGPLGTDWSY